MVNEKKKLSDMQFVGRLVPSLAFFDQVSEREVVLWILWYEGGLDGGRQKKYSKVIM